MKITEVFQDIAGKWRARVDLGDESIFLKFGGKNKPDDVKILAEAQDYVDKKAARAIRDANQKAKKLALTADVEAFDENTITKNEAINLAKKLIKNYYDPNGTTN